MPRKKTPGRLDHIADAATEVFIRQGFAKARITSIAELAKVGPGTVYLYAQSKEALFELALRRSWEDPTIWDIPLPHRSPARGEIADHAWRCIQNAAHFPLLWLAIDSPPPRNPRVELEGILQELGEWLHRYRRAIMLIERSADDWPDLSQMFYRRFWRGGVRRIADYLARRAGDGSLRRDLAPQVLANLTVQLLLWAMVHRYWAEDPITLPAEAVNPAVYTMLLDTLTPR